ncbi:MULTISPECIES: tetratricopeptide repeat protein [unclassified Calothrix]|uniref:tetratricopeptide repeat protein n=1 Tax=unclassified Calothrix TaxID=2619626 RepID=UPI0018F041BB|nr:MULTISPECIES: tetratricopeptide repeat protein [unclassified Calothrix]
MKGIKGLASLMVVFGLMVCAPKANAQNLPTNDLQTQFTQSSTDKDNFKTYISQGFTLLEKDDYRGAIQAFNQAIRIVPNNPYGYLGRGFAYFNLKQYQEAKSDFDQTINLDSNIGYAYLFRGMSNYALGSKQQAISDLQIAANIFQKAGETEMAQKSLDALERIRNA